MRDEDKYIAQIPLEVMFTDELLDEVATNMARGIVRRKKKIGAEGFKGTLREYMKAVLKRKHILFHHIVMPALCGHPVFSIIHF